MLWHNIKLTFRNLLKDLKNSCINILGLSVGMATVILIMIYVQNELSYDKFNSKYERIYRLTASYDDDKDPRCLRLTPQNFTNKLPEVEEVTQVYEFPQPIDYHNKRFTKFKHLYVDSNFYKVFDLDFLFGNPKKALAKQNGLVITSKCSETIFGKLNSIGEQVKINNSIYTVEGIVQKLPTTSHYSFDILTTMESNPLMEDLGGPEFLSYVLFAKNIDKKQGVEKALAVYNQMTQQFFEKYNWTSFGYLEPLGDVHLFSDVKNMLGDQGDIVSVLILIALAFVVLLIALINFINIMTVQYETKMNEIGLRKAIGANRIELIKQFLGNSFTYSLLALFIGLILSEIFLPGFNQIIQRNLKIDYFSNHWLLLGLVFILFFSGFASGTYPAFYLSRFRAAEIIKGSSTKGKNSLSFTKILVITQFTISVSLLSGLLIIQQQTDFMENADLGFQPQNVMGVISLNHTLKKSYDAIKQELSKLPEVQSVSGSDHFPGGGASGQLFYLLGENEKQAKSCYEYRVQADYFKTLGITCKEGYLFREGSKVDEKGIILNETAAKLINKEDIIGTKVHFAYDIYTIQGIVKDFHFRSLRSKIEPLLFSFRSIGMQCILVKYKTQDFSQFQKDIQQIFRKFDPHYNLNFIEVEKRNRNRYHQERRSMRIASYTSVLSIIIALIGLYSLSLFMIQKRTKEIGVRKVNGATVTQISKLFLGIFSKWILLAFIIATPLSWFCMSQWLNGFARKIDIGIFPFLLAGGGTLLIALLTVFFHTWRAATQNPIEALRYE